MRAHTHTQTHTHNVTHTNTQTAKLDSERHLCNHIAKGPARDTLVPRHIRLKACCSVWLADSVLSCFVSASFILPMPFFLCTCVQCVHQVTGSGDKHATRSGTLLRYTGTQANPRTSRVGPSTGLSCCTSMLAGLPWCLIKAWQPRNTQANPRTSQVGPSTSLQEQAATTHNNSQKLSDHAGI